MIGADDTLERRSHASIDLADARARRACSLGLSRPRCAGRRTRRRGLGLEPHRPGRDDSAQADRAWRVARDGHGGRRNVRRRQRIDGGHQPYLLDDDTLEAAGVDPQPWFSRDAAAATAAHDVLLALAPARQAVLDGLYTTTLDGLTDAFEVEGVAVGAAAADAMLATATA